MEVLLSIWNVVVAVANLLVELVLFVAPWVPLLAWIAFWLFAVNWKKLYPILPNGGIIGVILTGLMAILVWSVIAEPVGGVHHLYGLKVTNVYGKLMYVTSLFVIAALCGSVQLSGTCGRLCEFKEAEPQTHDHHTHEV